MFEKGIGIILQTLENTGFAKAVDNVENVDDKKIYLYFARILA